ncbi:MAG: LPS export ABC transporter permease LptF [Pseudomonadota bacterium]|nr:LPS export ABC transporter permease LptF [Pseudomonadota bacterium]
MYHYSRYIVRHLVHSTLLITFSLTSIVWLTQALRFIDFIVNQGVSIAIFVKLTVLLIPSLVMMILPPSFFCAVIFVYNKLKTDSELIVMQAAGLSKWRLAMPALQAALGVALVGYAISLYLMPVSYGKFRDMQNYLRNNYASILLEDGVFNTPVEGLTVFIRERDRDGVLHGILVHDHRQPQSSITMMAEEGKLVETPQGPRFLLKNGNRQEMQNGKLSLLNFESYTLDISLYAQGMKERPLDTQEMFLGQLFGNNDALPPEELQKRFAEAHQRIIWPAYALTLALVALAVLLSGEFNRRGHWQRVTLATVAGVAILFAAIGLRGETVAHAVAVPFAYLTLLLPAAAAWWILVDHMPGNKTSKAMA